jgi:hypothetical protein
MNNPFDWRNYTPILSMKDLDKARKNSFQQSTVVNNRRAKGIEPSIPYSDKVMDTEPRKFAIDMPKMPRYNKNEARKAKLKEKNT